MYVRGNPYIIYINTGKVIDVDGNVVTEDGGEDKLNELYGGEPCREVPTTIIIEGKTYYIYNNGTVIGENRDVICEKGGH